jgi:hypothetical protein
MLNTNPQQLTEIERDRVLQMYASGPLGYIPHIDKLFLNNGLFEWYDDEHTAVIQSVGSEVFYEESGSFRKEWYDGSLIDAVRFAGVIWKNGFEYLYEEEHHQFKVELINFKFGTSEDPMSNFSFEVLEGINSRAFAKGYILNVACNFEYYGGPYCPWQVYNL